MFVALLVRLVCEGAALLAVEAWVYVDAAGQEQAVRFGGQGVIFDDGVAGACGFDRVVIELGALPGRGAPVWDGNKRGLGHHMGDVSGRQGRPATGQAGQAQTETVGLRDRLAASRCRAGSPPLLVG